MRIGIDVSPIAARPTGVGRYTRAVLGQLLATGEHDFLGLSSGRHRPDPAIVAQLAAHRHLPLPTRALYALWSATGRPQADRLLGGVDLIHATNYYLPPVASAKRVVTIYDLSFLRHPEWSSPKIVGPFSRGIRRFAHDADAILTCSEASKKDIVELLDIQPAKVTVAYGAVEPAFVPRDREASRRRVATRYDIKAPFILFVGTLEARKNIAGLLAAFAHLQDKIPHELVLVGQPGWGTQDFDEALQRGKASGRVRVLGYLEDRDDLPHLYSAAEVFLFPSHYEGFGLPVLEALACACPVVTSNATSLPEVGGEAAVYVNPQDPASITSTLSRVLEDTALQARMREQGPTQAARFTWDSAAAATNSVYRSLA